jgi:hypothetical protein
MVLLTFWGGFKYQELWLISNGEPMMGKGCASVLSTKVSNGTTCRAKQSSQTHLLLYARFALISLAHL